MSEKRISVWCKADNQPGGVPEDYETRSYVPRSEIEAVVLETLAEVTAPPNWMTDGPLSVNVLRVRLDQMRAATAEAKRQADPFRQDVRELEAALSQLDDDIANKVDPRYSKTVPRICNARALVRAHLEKQ